MKTQLPPDKPRALLFDIDNTLYHHREYGEGQIAGQIHRFARHRRISDADAQSLVEAERQRLIRDEGRRPSLANTLAALGVPISESITWRKEEIHPERYLRRDDDLAGMMALLSGSYRLAALTNNPRDIGLRTLRCLGIGDYFEHVTGLDCSGESKPSWPPFQHILDALSLAVGETVMIGDRYDVDLAPMIERGGYGILVTNREELLGISAILEEAYGISSRR